jgi:predicted DCC family thiol-disulfide oxidoreductase YuxK
VSGWTGGHYSLFRFLFAGYLAIHFAGLVPWGSEMFSSEGALPEGSASPLLRLFPNVLAVWDAPIVITAMLVAAAGLAVLLCAGYWDRAAALGIWYIQACLVGRNPLINDPGLPYVGWILLAMVFIPAAPYGSWARRRQTDPGTGWRTPAALHNGAWILMALGYSYSGYTKLASQSWVDGTAFRWIMESPLARPNLLREAALALPDGVLQVATWGVLGLEIAFAPLALVPGLRPWLWCGMVVIHVGIMATADFVGASLGIVMLHLFTFDPAWVPARMAGAGEMVFYDGHCGLCHGFVRFLLSEDRAAAFRLAPLQGETFQAAASEEERARLGDSIVLQRADGVLLCKSEAVLYLLERLGGPWRVAAVLGRVFGRRMRDGVYDFIASIRYRLVARPADVCPVLPAGLRSRFSP